MATGVWAEERFVVSGSNSLRFFAKSQSPTARSYTVDMDIARRLVWFAIVATAGCFAILVVLGNVIFPATAGGSSVAVRDIVTPDAHWISGALTLPLTCDELSLSTKKLSATVYELVFQTWQDPSVPCSQESTPRTFQTVVFAPPSGVSFVATLDGRPFAITIISEVGTSTPL